MIIKHKKYVPVIRELLKINILLPCWAHFGDVTDGAEACPGVS
jgi:hypothetical protein